MTNTGDFDGKEAVRLFRSEVCPPPNQPIKSLIRFAKISLKAGESREVEFTVPAEESFRINDAGKKEYLPHTAFRYFTEA